MHPRSGKSEPRRRRGWKRSADRFVFGLLPRWRLDTGFLVLPERRVRLELGRNLGGGGRPARPGSSVFSRREGALFLLPTADALPLSLLRGATRPPAASLTAATQLASPNKTDDSTHNL